MTLSPGPPPWPIPPSWTLRAPTVAEPPPPAPAPVAEPEPVRPPVQVAPGQAVPEAVPLDAPGAGAPAIVLLVPGGAGAHDVLGDVPGVTVETRPLPTPSRGFTGVYELAATVTGALADGSDGAVLLLGPETLEETAWALELLHTAAAPLVVTAYPGRDADVADAVGVAAAAPHHTGCLLVRDGEIHLARHAGSRAPAPMAGPLGYVTDGAVRLLWKLPERLTVSGDRTDGRAPRVGLHTSALGDDGELLVALAERCDGLVVTANAAGGVPEELADVLAEAATRIPVVLVSPTGHDTLPVTTLDPLRARVLMHLLLATGRDRDAVLDAFAAAAGPGPVRL